MHDSDQYQTRGAHREHLTRRRFLRGLIGAGAGLATVPLLMACGGAVPTATVAPSPAPSTAASSATASARPSAAASVAPVGAPSTAPSVAPSAAASTAPLTPTAIAGLPRAKSSSKVTGKYQFVQYQDFHPDHNAFIRAEIQEFCKTQGWTLDITYASGFQGSGDLLTALIGAVQAGNPPDAMYHDIGVFQYQSQNVLEKVTDLTKEAIEKYGETYPGYIDGSFFGNEWWGVPFYGRTVGLYVRKDIFAKNGLDPDRDTETYDKMRETALKLSDPENKSWGWGLTVNRSGDGTNTVANTLLHFGSQLQDKEGQRVTFNSKETVDAVKWLKETYTDPKWAKMLPPGVLSWNDLGNNEAFLAGTLSMTHNGGTMYAKAVYDKVPHANQILFLPNPKRRSDGKRLDSLAGARLHIIKGTKNRDASADLIRHLVSEPVLNQLFATSPGFVIPPYKKAWASPLIQGNENAKRAEPLAYPTDRFTGLRDPGPPSAAIDAIGGGNYFTDMLGEVLQGKSPEEAVKAYSDRFIQIFKDFGLRGN